VAVGMVAVALSVDIIGFSCWGDGKACFAGAAKAQLIQLDTPNRRRALFPCRPPIHQFSAPA
jgi:hypothetical protein